MADRINSSVQNGPTGVRAAPDSHPSSHTTDNSKTPNSASERGSGPVRVLIMDDDEMIRELASAVFSRYGFEVTAAEDGAEAMSMFEKARAEGRAFALAVLDLRIPDGLGGREVVSMLKEIDPDVKAVVASGDGFDPVMAKYAEHGFDEAVTKPFSLQNIESLLKKLNLPVSR